MYPLTNLRATLLAVIVGSLPALKLLLASRASANRSHYGSSRRSAQQQVSNNASLHSKSKSFQLSSLSSGNKKTESGSWPEAGNSQEDILRPDGAQFILVEHDIVSSHQSLRELLSQTSPQ